MRAAVCRRYGPPDAYGPSSEPGAESSGAIVTGVWRPGPPHQPGTRGQFGPRGRSPCGLRLHRAGGGGGPAVTRFGADPGGRRCYPLARIADAYRHVDAGHKKGSIVVTMS